MMLPWSFWSWFCRRGRDTCSSSSSSPRYEVGHIQGNHLHRRGYWGTCILLWSHWGAWKAFFGWRKSSFPTPFFCQGHKWWQHHSRVKHMVRYYPLNNHIFSVTFLFRGLVFQIKFWCDVIFWNQKISGLVYS